MQDDRGRKASQVDFELAMATNRANLKNLGVLMNHMKDLYPIYAMQYKAFYDALMAQGFSGEQALEIVKIQGWAPKW